MYSTPKDVHVAITSKLMQINISRNKTFRSEEIDELFNSTMLKFIEERSIATPIPNGLDETVKRNDDLIDLKVSDKEVSILYRKPSTFEKSIVVASVLPVDYYKFESLDLAINYDCTRVSTPVEDSTISIKSLQFDPITNVSELDNFKIEADTITVYSTLANNLQGFTNLDARFIVINNVLEVLNRDSGDKPFTIYWETYCDIYKKDHFIIIPDDPTTEFVLDTVLQVNDDTDVTYSYKEFTETVVTHNVPTELVQSKDLNLIKGNRYMYKNRYKKPLIELTRGIIKIDYNPHYTPLRGFLTYIKRPILLNLKAGIMTDFKSHISEVIDLTVTNMALTLAGNAEAMDMISKKNLQ